MIQDSEVVLESRAANYSVCFYRLAVFEFNPAWASDSLYPSYTLYRTTPQMLNQGIRHNRRSDLHRRCRLKSPGWVSLSEALSHDFFSFLVGRVFHDVGEVLVPEALDDDSSLGDKMARWLSVENTWKLS